jgi:SAM-dependent methyltransferase
VKHAISAADVKITNKDYGLTFPLRQCQNCGFVFADTLTLATNSVPELYTEMVDQAYIDTLSARALEMQDILRVGLRHHPRAQTILDVGAGAGLLARAAQQQGLTPTGIEPSRWLIEQAARVMGVALVHGTLPHPSLADRKFDLVFAIDVIEHVDDPIALLTNIKNYLQNDGVAVISTPDRDSVAARILGSRWWHYRIAHIGYFNRKSLHTAARQSGFKISSLSGQTWYFPVSYLVERVFTYAPRLVPRRRGIGLGRLGKLTIPVNLRDHLVAVLRKI